MMGKLKLVAQTCNVCVSVADLGCGGGLRVSKDFFFSCTLFFIIIVKRTHHCVPPVTRDHV